MLDAAALRRGVPTVVATGGRGAATATGDLLFARAFAELAALDPRRIDSPQDAERVCDRIEATGALDDARARALAMVQKAKAALPAVLPGERSGLLELVADAVVERYR